MADRRMNLPCFIGYGLLAALLLAAALYIFHAVPFDPASYLAWIGIGAILLGLASLVRPLRFLAVPNRRVAASVAAAGVVIVALCLLWPVSMKRATGEAKRLDRFLPVYEFNEYHEAFTWAPRGEIEEAMRRVSLADMPILWLPVATALSLRHEP